MADSYILTCPHCGLEGGSTSMFEMSLSDECFCPNGCDVFILEEKEDND